MGAENPIENNICAVSEKKVFFETSIIHSI